MAETGILNMQEQEKEQLFASLKKIADQIWSLYEKIENRDSHVNNMLELLHQDGDITEEQKEMVFKTWQYNGHNEAITMLLNFLEQSNCGNIFAASKVFSMLITEADKLFQSQHQSKLRLQSILSSKTDLQGKKGSEESSSTKDIHGKDDEESVTELFISEARMQDIQQKGEECSIIKWLSFTKSHIEVHYTGKLDFREAKGKICEELDVTDISESVMVYQAKKSDYTLCADWKVGEAVQSTASEGGHEAMVAIGAFGQVEGNAHFLTTSHEQLKPGNIVRLVDQPSLVATVRVVITSPKDGCDVALVELGEGPLPQNRVTNQQGEDFTLGLASGVILQFCNKVCYKFQTAFDRETGVVDRVIMYKGVSGTFMNCFAIKNKTDQSKAFLVRGKCGTLVVLDSSDENPRKLKAFGLFFGTLDYESTGQDGARKAGHLAIACNFLKTLELLNQHQYCSGRLKLL